MSDPLILDTNVFDRKDFLYWLEGYFGRKILPVVAYSEICVHFIRGSRLLNLEHMLNKINIEIAWLRRSEALVGAYYGVEGGDFKKNARDYLIGAHVYPPPRTLVTGNKNDFWFIDEKWVYDPDEIMARNSQ